VKRILLICLGLLLFVGCFYLAVAEETKVRFMELQPPFRSLLTADESALVRNKVTTAYPYALDRVCTLFDDEKLRKLFDPLLVAIYDHAPQANRLGQSVMIDSYNHRRQGITLFAIPILYGNHSTEKIVVHEMIHASFEKHCSFREMISRPDILNEGIAYFGADQIDEYLTSNLNRGWPKMSVKEIIEDKSNFKYFREVTFGYCLQHEYGEQKYLEIVRRMYRGKRWKATVESVTGDSWKTVKAKCKGHLLQMLSDRIDAAEPYRKTKRAYKNKDYTKAIELGLPLMAQEDFPWRISTAWCVAWSYRKAQQLDEALDVFEQIRQGKFGPTNLNDNAAYYVIDTLITAGKCEQAKANREEYQRLYQSFWQNWRDDLNKMIKECNPAPE